MNEIIFSINDVDLIGFSSLKIDFFYFDNADRNCIFCGLRSIKR